MLAVFPQILFLAPFSATILRISAGFVFLWLAYFHYTNRKAVMQELSLFIGGASVICYIYIVIELAVALGLIAGAFTQVAALVGFVIALKILLLRNRLHDLKPLSSVAYALLAVICFSLIFTGAGPLGFDLPL